MAATEPGGHGATRGDAWADAWPDGSGPDALRVLDVLPQPAFAVEVVDHETFRFVHANPRYRALLGLPRGADVTGDLRAVLPADALVAHVRHLARAAREGRTVAFEVALDDGHRTLAVEAQPVPDRSGRCRHLVGVAGDLTEHKRVESLLAHRTRHDPLTDLPNRLVLLERLSEALERARATGQRVGLVLLDLDHFQVVNDSLGHAAGDQLLRVVARRVERVLRSGDSVARLGGDELAVVCNDAAGPGDVLAVAERVLGVFDEPFALDVGDVSSAASVGVVVSEPDDHPDRLLRDADVAMFAAKGLGAGRIQVFDAGMRERAVARLETEAALRRALLRDELRVLYQPVVRLDRSEVVGFEALVRWDHPQRGRLEPPEFLPIAEETGLIVPVGAWVLREACEHAATWAAESSGQPPLAVSVNLSARQLAGPDLVATVEGALASARLDPSLLLIEVTETVVAEDRERAVEVLHAITALGVQVGIDRFGTGQSSLGALKTLPVRTLKIDRSLVDGLGTDPEDSAIVAAVVHLGHALGLTVAAEGIETPAQLAELRVLGCDLGQGFYFARPQPVEVVRALVHRRIPWREGEPGGASGGPGAEPFGAPSGYPVPSAAAHARSTPHA